MAQVRDSDIVGAKEIVGLPEGITIFQFSPQGPWNVMMDVTFVASYPPGGIDFLNHTKGHRVLAVSTKNFINIAFLLFFFNI